MKKLTLLVLLSLLLMACGNSEQTAKQTNTEPAESKTLTSTDTAESTDIDGLIQQAEDLYAQSLAAKHAWTVNRDLLKDAQRLAQDGDMDQAIANAEEAIKLAKLALIQADAEKDLWQKRVPQ